MSVKKWQEATISVKKSQEHIFADYFEYLLLIYIYVKYILQVFIGILLKRGKFGKNKKRKKKKKKNRERN